MIAFMNGAALRLTAAEIAQATRALTKAKTSAHAARAAYEKALAKHPPFAGVRGAEQAGRAPSRACPSRRSRCSLGSLRR